MKLDSSILRSAILSLLLLCAASPLLGAGFSANIDGVVVKYSLPGANAYYDPDDETLTINITQSGGTLSVTATKTAQAVWGSYVDVYMAGADVEFKSLKFTGREECRFYITGQCYHIRNFGLAFGYVGGTDFYGDRGIGMSGPFVIPTVKMRYSKTIGPLGGADYSAAGAAAGKALKVTKP